MGLQSDGKNGFTRITKSDDEDTEKAKKPAFGGSKAPPFGAGGKPAAPPAAAAGEDADEEKAKKAFKEAEEEKAKAKKAFDESEEKSKSAKKSLEDLEEKRKKAMGSSTADGDDEEAEKAKKAITSSLEKMLGEMSAPTSLAAVVETHKAFTDALITHKAFFENDEEKKKTSKVGAKMSAARKETFQKAIDSLSSLLAELMDSPAKANEHKPDPGDPQMRQPNAVKRDDSELVKLATESIELAKSTATENESLKAELGRLRKSIPGSNGITVEKGANGGRKPVAEVEWPLDMNGTPTDRASVDKGVSFYDD